MQARGLFNRSSNRRIESDLLIFKDGKIRIAHNLLPKSSEPLQVQIEYEKYSIPPKYNLTGLIASDMDNEHWYDIDTRKENSIKRLLAISIGEFRADNLSTLPSAAVDRVSFSADS